MPVAVMQQPSLFGWDDQRSADRERPAKAKIHVVADSERVRAAEADAEQARADYEAFEAATIEVLAELECIFLERPKMHKNWRSCQCRFCLWDQTADAKLPVLKRKAYRAVGSPTT